MKTNLRNSVLAAIILTFVLTLVGGLLTSPRRLAVAVEPEPAADSPDQYIWTLVYRIATKPGGEAVAVPYSPNPHQIKVSYTYVKEFRVRPDGTFAFDDCDFGFCRQEDVQEVNKVKFYSRTNAQGLLRGSGKWQPATQDKDETLTLRLECGAGDGATGDGNTNTVKYTESPDGRTVTTSSEIPGGKPISYSYPNTFVASEWTLKPNKEMPDGSRGAIPGRGLNVFPVSYLAAAEDECDDKKDQTFQGQRPTTLICAAGPKTPVTESVELKKKKKEADLAVTFGETLSILPPGSEGFVQAVVSNLGPCEATATVTVQVFSGGDTPSSVKIKSFTAGTRLPTEEKNSSGVKNTFYNRFLLPSGGQKIVKIEVKDTTPPGQQASYVMSFTADVTGDVPDPNPGNNRNFLVVGFDPLQKNPPKPMPTKAK